MLTSLILQLKAPAAASLPASLGRAGQALLLRLVGARDPDLAERLHQAAGLRPYTASNLVLGQRVEGSLQVKAGQTGWLRFTGLTQEVSQHLLALAAAPPETVEVDGVKLVVTGATLDPALHAWAGQTSYQELAAPFLLGGQPGLARRVRLEFVSPTTFRSGGQYLPLPAPELVFGSLLDRWQAFAPIALHPETRRFAAEAVALSRYHLRTRGVPYKHPKGGANGREGGETGGGGWLIGFTGSATFAIRSGDRYWLNVLHLLAGFAFYSGVGYQTGAGLGQARLKSEERGRARKPEVRSKE